MSKNWPCWFYEITRQRMVRRAKNMMNHHVKTPLEKKIADDYLDYLYTYMLFFQENFLKNFNAFFINWKVEMREIWY